MPELPPLGAPLSDGAVALRGWRATDTAPMTAGLNDAEIARWTRVPSPYTEADAGQYLQRMEEQRLAGYELALAIVAAGSGELLGSISVRATSWEHLRGELGYLVFAAARGSGAAPRAVRLLSRFAFDEVGLERLELFTATGNTASQRVAEKAGFVREGVLRSYTAIRDARLDMISWSLLPGELEPAG